MKAHFDHEKPDVNQDAIGFVSMLAGLIRSTAAGCVYETSADCGPDPAS
jgi:hypothetical protein